MTDPTLEAGLRECAELGRRLGRVETLMDCAMELHAMARTPGRPREFTSGDLLEVARDWLAQASRETGGPKITAP